MVRTDVKFEEEKAFRKSHETSLVVVGDQVLVVSKDEDTGTGTGGIEGTRTCIGVAIGTGTCVQISE